MERAEIRERLDYRNARYEGRTKKGMPHGEGIVIDLNYLFCLASWREGQIDGPCFVVFPDGSIFCGRIIEKQMVGMCTLYLKDHIRIFTNSV